MNKANLLYSVVMSTLLLLSNCSRESDISRLFQNVMEHGQTTYTYNGELFEAVVTSSNGAWIVLRGDQWTEITVHNTLTTANRITSNNDDIDPEELIENLQPME